MRISLYYLPFNSFCNVVIITVKDILDPRQELACFISVFKIAGHQFLKQKKGLRAGWAPFGGKYPYCVIK